MLPTIASYTAAPAKTRITSDGSTVLGRSVLSHCHIVGEVARAMIQAYPSALRDRLFPPDAAFAAACHDIGKVSPYFVEKLRQACTDTPEGVPIQNGINPQLEKNWGGHAGVSQATAKALGAPKWVPEVLGQHHGFSPQLGMYQNPESEVFGGAAWQTQRNALVQDLKQRLGMEWPQLQSEAQARLVAGLTSVADWIGSGQHFENPDQAWQGMVDIALQESGWIAPSYQKGRSFIDVFGFAPRAVQQQLMDAAAQPGVYVLEAPMGLGKTEAALYAAYQMLQSGQASGIYFALPTQLTSNKIHERFNAFLAQILAADCPHRSALLLHGKAWLQEHEMGEEGRPGGAWFNNSKRGLLAPFAVGTIDQALMAAMNVKHGFVRAFGLAGKVVILDEVHTYDAYTGTLLDALVKLLRQLHCTVIILSATLNQERRAQMVQASLNSSAYPLITAVRGAPDASQVQEFAVDPPQLQTVSIHACADANLAVQEAIHRAAQGQQVLWLENTVAQAQERYMDLAARAHEVGATCGLLHSRFTAVDRQKIEEHWVNAFGKGGHAQRGQQGRILVGTQVLEQSLDIDADFLVTAFAPTDMLLQRLGRLWRHSKTPRPDSAACEAWLLTPDLEIAIAQPERAFGNSADVYAPYVLCRSLQVWQALQQVILPTDIRPLIEATYAQREETGDMARWLHELDHGRPQRPGKSKKIGRIAMQQLARIGLATAGKTQSDVDAPTRYSETDSHEVLLLRRVAYNKESQTTQITLLDGSRVELPTQRQRLSKAQWKQLTSLLMQQQVPVSERHAPNNPSRERLQKLGFGHCFHLGNPEWEDDRSALRLALVDEVGVLAGLDGTNAHDRHSLEYRSDLGYRQPKRDA
ncbi:MAG: CRISPR-associated helicase Cas3' [Brachymonas sp.]